MHDWNNYCMYGQQGADPGICEREATLPSFSSPLEVGPFKPARGPEGAL